MAACRILIPPRCEDACCGVPRAAAAPASSCFYGRSVRLGGRSAADLQRKAGVWRSVAVAEAVTVDGVKAEEKLTEAVGATSPVEEPAIEEEPPLAAADVKSFLADVSSLVKLVDSKDIVELELKHKDYEIVIRKAEALAPPPAAAPPVPAAAGLPYPMFPPSAFAMPTPAPMPAAPSPSPAVTQAAEAPQAAPSAPQYPPMVSPMAGNFYRSPGPGEPPFVKLGDKVRKGQVLCIIEAMKLMNSIESDQDGTLVEIVAEDGKPVAADDPLFVIKP
ncbi:biotin carboxyl carrier protein of acetyl-CoA carboxylase 2, chloroplastic isoform X1 [Selaginella moellendorffii]|nr:biotin carboxyl carrier protein of acetyl-CoA carboxylase 2, chloroplastic isoform X1 [Selaginella moellendorffii]|eukprot:XP_002988286.2 biotin carboxyl carrier protein of acetyl-CoA carboxylase 2, chloroplastic isoform X1 [Selaginella moellendorffii]